MTEKAFTSLVAANEGKNFHILTNIARGRGINGVDYLSFWGLHRWEENQNKRYEQTTICDCTENCVHIIVKTNRDSWGENGTYDYYIPLENIVAVVFVESQNGRYTEEKYPSRI